MRVTKDNNECSTISHAENYTYMDKILLIHTETLIEVVSMGKSEPKFYYVISVVIKLKFIR